MNIAMLAGCGVCVCVCVCVGGGGGGGGGISVLGAVAIQFCQTRMYPFFMALFGCASLSVVS